MQRKISLSRFRGEWVKIRTVDGEELSGMLTNIDRGNLILSGGTIIREKFMKSIAAEDSDSIQIVEAFGKPIYFLPPRLYDPLEKIAKREGVPLEELINALLKVGVEQFKANSKLWV